MTPTGRILLTAACAVLSAAALVNVFANNDDVLLNAQQVACGGKSCTVTRAERTPFAQTFELRAGTSVFVVRCARSAVFFGEYACSRR